MSGTVIGTPRADLEDTLASSQILVAGKRLAEGVRDGFFTMMDDLRTIAVNESPETTIRRRNRSPTRPEREDTKSEFASENIEPHPWYPKNSSPMKRDTRRGSDASVSTRTTTSTETKYDTNLTFINF